MEVSVHAITNGEDYPVKGSVAADSIAYSRADVRSQTGIGKIGGAISIRETITLGADYQSLSIAFSLVRNGQPSPMQLASFDRAI